MYGMGKHHKIRGERFVRRVGLEPTRPKTPAPKAGASASSATGALVQLICQKC